MNRLNFFHLTLAIAAFAAQPAVQAFTSIEGANIHADITAEALRGVLSEGNLKFVIEANQNQDKPGTEGIAELRRHFGDESFLSALAYIDREKRRALNYAVESDTDAEARGYALRHFGEMLHSVQDFYSRTNYIELMVANSQYKQSPYDIPLVDWTKVPAGYPGLKCFSAKAGSSNAGELALIVKDNAETSGGKKVISGKVTQFQVAKELAIRETSRQWNLFETLIRSRTGSRAPAIIAALKQAGPAVSKTKPEESE